MLAIPIISPLGLPLKVSPLTKEAYDMIQDLPEGSKVLYHTCIYPGCMGEMESPTVATIRQFFRNDHKLYFLDLQESGVGIMNILPPLLENSVPEFKDAVYDEDYVMLGFYAGGEATAKAFATDVKSIVKVDMFGTPVGDLEMMKDINSVSDFDMIINVGECNNYIMFQMSKPYGVETIMCPLMFGLAPDIMPQYEAGVVQGVIAGLRGGAEFEFLSGLAGKGIVGLDSISTSHGMVIGLLILGNLGMVMKKISGDD
jgi:hypothetical protein